MGFDDAGCRLQGGKGKVDASFGLSAHACSCGSLF